MKLIQLIAEFKQMEDFHRGRLDCTPVRNHAYSLEHHQLGLKLAVEMQERLGRELRGEPVEEKPQYYWQRD